MSTATQVGGFDHRGTGADVAVWTARGLALYPFSVEVVLAASTPMGRAEMQAPALRATLESVSKVMAVGRGSRFDALYCLSVDNGGLHARLGVRLRMITESVWEWVASRHGLDVIDYVDVHAVDALVVSKRILAEPLSTQRLPEDVASKITERHLAMNGNRWVRSHGKPFIDEEGRALRGIQEARERAIAIWEEEGRTD